MSIFDFFVVKAYSDRIRPLMKIPGVERKSIRTQTFYSGRFPTKVHSVSLVHQGVEEIGHRKAKEKVEKILEEYENDIPPGVKFHIEFYPRD